MQLRVRILRGRDGISKVGGGSGLGVHEVHSVLPTT